MEARVLDTAELRGPIGTALAFVGVEVLAPRKSPDSPTRRKVVGALEFPDCSSFSLGLGAGLAGLAGITRLALLCSSISKSKDVGRADIVALRSASEILFGI